MLQFSRRLVLTLFVIAPVSLISLLPVHASSPSVAGQCDGSAQWLSDSEDRFRPFVPLLTELLIASGLSAEELVEFVEAEAGDTTTDQTNEDAIAEALSSSYLEDLPVWAAAAEASMQHQAASSPPPAAAQLNAQIVVVLGTYAVAFDTLSDALSDIALGNDAPDVLVIVANALAETEVEESQARELARTLKLRCSLSGSGEFFDPMCYGEQADRWYERTNARVYDMSRSLDQSGADSALGAIRARQDEDVPPTALVPLQSLYLSFYDEAEALLNGMSNIAEFEQALYRIGHEVDSEKARLDIACAARAT